MLLGLLPFFLHSDQDKGEQSSLGYCSARRGQTGPHKGCKALTHPGAAGLPCQPSPDNTISNTSPCLKGHPHKVSVDPVLQLRKQEMEACRGQVPDPRHRSQGWEGWSPVSCARPSYSPLTACCTEGAHAWLIHLVI